MTGVRIVSCSVSRRCAVDRRKEWSKTCCSALQFGGNSIPLRRLCKMVLTHGHVTLDSTAATRRRYYLGNRSHYSIHSTCRLLVSRVPCCMAALPHGARYVCGGWWGGRGWSCSSCRLRHPSRRVTIACSTVDSGAGARTCIKGRQEREGKRFEIHLVPKRDARFYGHQSHVACAIVLEPTPA